MRLGKLIDLEGYPVKKVLKRLLQDKTTKQNIIYATDAYKDRGEAFSERSQMQVDHLIGMNPIIIQPRVEKATEAQQLRTRKKAEVFTPSWIVNKMNNHCDEEWFGRPNVFNTEDGTGWITNPEPIVFKKRKPWKHYVDSRRLEITCGEAPYIVSRYNATTGELIPIEDRIGFLDRKLRVVNENVEDDAEWHKWAERAFQSSYGYEFQGDNLLIARINLLLTYTEHYERRFHEYPNLDQIERITNIICWNIWQMDGITGTIPFSIPKGHDDDSDDNQTYLEEFFGDIIRGTVIEEAPVCKVYDWRRDNSISYDDIRKGVKR